MDSTSSSSDSWIIKSAGCGEIGKLKKKRDEIGDERMFRRMCDSVTDSLGYRALHAAALMGQVEVSKFLVEEVRVDIDVKAYMGYTPLLVATSMGLANVAKYLIEQGADVTATDYRRCTALHYCIQFGYMDIMDLLLTKGADIEVDSVYGTPLHCAVRTGRAGKINFLLQNKAEPNSVSKCIGGLTPLVYAMFCKTNTTECVELLLNAKADPNMASNGLSPLAHAVEAGTNCCINSLLAAGADVDSISSFGLRPIEHAAFVNNDEAVWMLILARPGILATPNWSFSRLVYSMIDDNSEIYLHGQVLRQIGDDAWDKQDYSSAVMSYNEAMRYNPSVELYANQSLCWARKSEGAFALHDAKECVKQKPGWAKAHLREATAWHLLEGYHMSCDSFMKAYKLDPENENIERELDSYSLEGELAS